MQMLLPRSSSQVRVAWDFSRKKFLENIIEFSSPNLERILRFVICREILEILRLDSWESSQKTFLVRNYKNFLVNILHLFLVKINRPISWETRTLLMRYCISQKYFFWFSVCAQSVTLTNLVNYSKPTSKFQVFFFASLLPSLYPWYICLVLFLHVQ